MKNKVAGVCFGIALGGLSSTTANADAYGGPSYVVPYFSWTGLYVGGQAGAGWADTHWLNNHFTGVGTCAAAVNFNLQCDPVNQSSTSFVGGGQVGKRWQTGPWVIGIEASFAYARFHERSADVNSHFAAPDINEDKTNLNALFTSTLQLGYAWDRTLWYVKGGYAASSLSQETITIVPGTGSFVAPTGSRFANGFTVGTGLEFALGNNFSIGVEYDYVRLDSSDATTCSTGIASAFSCGTPGSIALRYTDFHADVNEVVARLNYKFGDREYAPLK